MMKSLSCGGDKDAKFMTSCKVAADFMPEQAGMNFCSACSSRVCDIRVFSFFGLAAMLSAGTLLVVHGYSSYCELRASMLGSPT